MNAEDKQDDTEFMKRRLNQRLYAKLRELQLIRTKNLEKQEKNEQKERVKKNKNEGKKKVTPKYMSPDVPENLKSNLADQEREIHEAYQILLSERKQTY